MIDAAERARIATAIGARLAPGSDHSFVGELPTYLAENFRVREVSIDALREGRTAVEAFTRATPVYHHQIRTELSPVSFAETEPGDAGEGQLVRLLALRSDVARMVDQAQAALAAAAGDAGQAAITMLSQPALQLRALWGRAAGRDLIAVAQAPSVEGGLVEGKTYLPEEFAAAAFATASALGLAEPGAIGEPRDPQDVQPPTQARRPIDPVG